MPIENGIQQPSFDWTASAGLSGTPESIGYVLAEVETHDHSRVHLYGKSGVDNFLLENSHTPWRVQAGTSEAFGSWVQLSNGDEISAPYYDPHELGIMATSSATAAYFIELGTGEAGAQVVVGGAWFHATATLRNGSTFAQVERVGNTEKLWARCNSDTDSATIDFTVLAHHYPG